MTQDVIAVYPGTFDPMTLGHESLLDRISGLFSHVIVAVAVAHHKKTLFSLSERIEMVKEAVKHNNLIEVSSFDGLMRDFVVERGVKVMVRGVRSSQDFDYEYQLAGMNRHLMPDVETIFLPPTVAHQFVSSTYVREIATLGGDISGLVSASTKERVMKKVLSKSSARVGSLS